MLTIRSDTMAQLAHTIKTGINTPEPHGGPRGPGPFGGSYDWHSCVHAHWTLLAMERFGVPADPWLHERLASSVLETECKYLRDNPAFEMPYGRAWLLLLISELRRQGHADDLLESLNQQLHTELINYLETHPFPEHPERNYPYLGTHRSWIFTHWMSALAAQLNSDDTRAYRMLYESRVSPVSDHLRQHDPVPNDFLDLKIMADLEILLWQRGAPSELKTTDVPAAVDAENAHMMGRLFQELWAQAAYNPPSIQRRFDDLLATEYLWKFDFKHASHFVPQFAWMAVYLSEFYASQQAT